ncbi:MAG: hypothetical protein RL748_12, partial [Pseudomonadota bacterium]
RGNVTFGPGKFGKAAVFGGVDKPGSIRIPNSPSLQFSTGTSFAFWARVDGYRSMNGYGSVSTDVGGGAALAKSHDRTGGGMMFWLDKASDPFVGMATFEPWSQPATRLTTARKNIGDWVHVVMNLSAQSGTRVYLDGKLHMTNPTPVNFNAMNQQDLYLGQFSQYWYPFWGALDELRIYNRTLSESEISILAEVPEPAPKVPDAPGAPQVSAGDSQLSVAFTAPANPGSSPIVSYTATCNNISLNGTASPIVINNAVNNVSYTCTVKANNAAGSSAASGPSNAVTPRAVQTIPTNGMVAYYSFDNNTPNITAGNANNGQVSGNVAFGAGKFGQAAIFGGVSSAGRIRIPNSSALQFAKEGSFSFWAKLNGYKSMDGYGSISSDFAGGTMLAKSHDRTGAALMLRLDKSNEVYSGVQTFEAWAGGAKRLSTDKKVLNTWIHVALNMSAQTGTEVYIDGKLHSTTTTPVNFAAMNQQDLYIGQFSDSFWYPLWGGLDELRIYNRILTKAEIGFMAGVTNSAPLRLAIKPKATDLKLPVSGTFGKPILVAGNGHSAVVHANGSLLEWGQTPNPAPANLRNLVAVAQGSRHGLALTVAGKVVAWGDNALGQTDVPPGLGNVIAIASGANHNLALRADGTVAAWGQNLVDEVKGPISRTNIVAIAAGEHFSLLLDKDGNVYAHGVNDHGQTDIPRRMGRVQAMAAGAQHVLALQTDGRVIAWGDNTHGQAVVPDGLDGVVAVAAGANHSLALRADGTVVAWGGNDLGQSAVPKGLDHVIAIAAGNGHSLALRSDGSVVAWGSNQSGQSTIPPGLNLLRASAKVDLVAAKNRIIAVGQQSQRASALPSRVAVLPSP